jgi:hypothetical protein
MGIVKHQVPDREAAHPGHWFAGSCRYRGCGRHPVRLGVLALLLQASAFAAVSAEGPALALHEGWSAYFGGREQVFHVAIKADREAGSCQVGWELAADGRAIARGEQVVQVGPAGVAACAIPIHLPPVKDGVIAPAVLTIAARLAGSGTPAAITRPLWLFPETPFTGVQARLREQRLHLLDPHGSTRAVLDQSDVPYESVRSAEALAEQAPCTLIVGSGISLTEHRGLFAALVHLASRGHRVLWLAPRAGTGPFPGPGAAASPPTLTRVEFRGRDVISALDKRLDAQSWPPDGILAAAGVGLRADRGRVLMEFGSGADEANGWPWARLDFGGGGRLVVCGFPIVERWEDGPVPRFLLARILDWLVEQEKEYKP